MPGIQIRGGTRFSERFRGQGWQPSTSFLDVFDWRFERYITPWVVRATWVWLVVQGGLIILLFLFAMLDSVVDRSPSKPVATSKPDVTDQGGWRFQAPDFSSSDSSGPSSRTLQFLASGFARVVLMVIVISAVVFWLLWCRVVLESVIVIFNIAATLKSIEATAEGRAT